MVSKNSCTVGSSSRATKSGCCLIQSEMSVTNQYDQRLLNLYRDVQLCKHAGEKTYHSRERLRLNSFRILDTINQYWRTYRDMDTTINELLRQRAPSSTIACFSCFTFQTVITIQYTHYSALSTLHNLPGSSLYSLLATSQAR